MKSKLLNLLVALAFSAGILTAAPLGTAFTYQGRLNDDVNPANGIYAFRFTIYDAAENGTQVGGAITNSPVTVSNGLFTATLDFGASPFNVGLSRWLQIEVSTNGSPSFIALTPRQPLTPTPYSLYAPNAGTAALASRAAAGSITSAALAPGAVTGTAIASGQVVKSVNGLRDDLSLAAGDNVTLTPAGQTLTLASPTDWHLAGNAGTTPGTHLLGTTDNQPLEFKVNNTRALRLEPNTSAAPNVIGGSPRNVVDAGVVGATIGGGGATNFGGVANTNRVAASFGVVAGGAANTVSGAGAAIGGGGYDGSSVNGNTASGAGSVIAGGTQNLTSGSRSTIGGGHNNSATNWYATVPGGAWNLAGGQGSLAAGQAAKALHNGTFVWSDTSSPDFVSTATEQFLIRASGGVGIGTNHPQSALHVAGTVTADAFNTAGPAANEPPSGVTPILNMIWIKPGTFVMGSSTNELDRVSDEGPQTVVTLTKGFWMGHHEVTQGEFQSLMNSNPSAFTGDLSLPVERVSWFDATNFCWVLTQREQAAGRLPAGWGYRLPTEAEWEYCCRSLTTTRFYFGDDPSSTNLSNYAWYNGNSGSKSHPVGQKLANAWGLVDMSGNEWEWCRDWYAGSYPGGSVTDPQGPGTGSERVMRGGSWGQPASNCRTANRDRNDPSIRVSSLGFRVVLAPSQP